jgi:hypothetical protein
VTYSADGTRLASGSWDETVKVWDTASGKELRSLKGHLNWIYSVTFSPDGARLASASNDQTLKLWDAASGQELRTLKGHAGGATSVAFSSDGKRLASACWDGTVYVWDARSLTPDILVEREARDFVEFLCAKPLGKTQVIQNLNCNKTISEPVRQKALAFAGLWQEQPDPWNNASWRVVCKPGADPGRYRLALSQAENACRLAPGNGSYLNTLGVAQYRVGQYKQALGTLSQSEKLNAIQFKGTIPADLAFLAMAHYNLGQIEKAQAYLKRLRETMKKALWAENEEACAFLREVEALLNNARRDSKD